MFAKTFRSAVSLALVFCLSVPMTALATNSPSSGWYCGECGEWVSGGGACSNGHFRPGTTTPPTGDTSMINMWIIVMIIALAALCVAEPRRLKAHN